MYVFDYKNIVGKGPCEQLVSPEPEVCIEDRTGKDEFVVLACDGIWDVMNNEELCDFVKNRMQLTNDLKEICNMVVDTCLYKVAGFLNLLQVISVWRLFYFIPVKGFVGLLDSPQT